ncbi:putative membrane protein [Halalkaliarchaeum sp. AArc-CO]|uniref:hypothetical protein n=1 Tax=Halalkaliarchaeum sp. AArc-CO TaxID=2866381 RepID=UPI00217D00AB|nr:hypothetical protein [Halalkaliarchaeum sp. AArc-CO]UWG50537.1 putative membrane protein [Halalkaliarchaeum sp. AArc-CO]
MAYETSQPEPSAVDVLVANERFLWLVAVVFFGIGDLLTTVAGLHLEQIVETGPLVADVIAVYGVPAMVALKLAVFAICYGLWRVVPAPHRMGVPLGLAVLGVLVTLWNVAIIGVVLL